ncbi:MAG: hypothetical protein ACPGTQ_15725 [Colwellia sp.]
MQSDKNKFLLGLADLLEAHDVVLGFQPLESTSSYLEPKLRSTKISKPEVGTFNLCYLSPFTVRLTAGMSKKEAVDKHKVNILNKEIFNKKGSHKALAIKEEKPVYTKEMYENGDLPSVGMECIACYEINGKQEERVTIAHINEKGHFACIDSYGDYMIQYVKEDSDEHFKPIDTRTDEEKAIDDLAKCVGDCMSDYGIFQAIKEGKIHGVTWSKGNE